MKSLSSIVFEILFLTLFIVLVPILSIIDINFLGNTIVETGITKSYQILLILLINTFLWKILIIDKKNFNFNILVLGFFIVVFIRELDWLFDNIRHGFWKYMAITISLIFISFSIKARDGFMESLNNFVSSKYYYTFIIGFIILMVFSRLMGTKEFFKFILIDKTAIINIKNIIQESLESLGYTVILFATAKKYKEIKLL